MHEAAAQRTVRAVPTAGSVAAAVGVAGVATTWFTGGDHAGDLAAALAQLPWAMLLVGVALTLVAVVHFVSAGLALRGVSDGRLPVRQVTMAQLAAAAANRVVPNGLGGAAVNARYLLRCGLAPGAVGSALALLAVIGGITDALYVAGITAFGPSVGLGGAPAELLALTRAGGAGSRRDYWVLVIVLTIGATVAAVRFRGRVAATAGSAVRRAASHLRGLLRRPRQLVVAATASMVTTTVLSAGFVLAARTWGHAASPVPAGALVAVYWVAASAGGATPLPAFVGVTEMALVAGLVLNHYTPASALLVALIFRAVTYWLPLPIGVWAAQRLRRSQLL